MAWGKQGEQGKDGGRGGGREEGGEGGGEEGRGLGEPTLMAKPLSTKTSSSFCTC